MRGEKKGFFAEEVGASEKCMIGSEKLVGKEGRRRDTGSGGKEEKGGI